MPRDHEAEQEARAKETVASIVCFVLAVIIVAWSLRGTIHWMRHPEKTEMQIFLWNIGMGE